jgi:hypothetical protein
LFNDVLSSLDAGYSTSACITTLAQSMNASLLLCGALASVESGQVIDAEQISGGRVVETIQALYEPNQSHAAGKV